MKIFLIYIYIYIVVIKTFIEINSRKTPLRLILNWFFNFLFICCPYYICLLYLCGLCYIHVVYIDFNTNIHIITPVALKEIGREQRTPRYTSYKYFPRLASLAFHNKHDNYLYLEFGLSLEIYKFDKRLWHDKHIIYVRVMFFIFGIT